MEFQNERIVRNNAVRMLHDFSRVTSGITGPGESVDERSEQGSAFRLRFIPVVTVTPWGVALPHSRTKRFHRSKPTAAGEHSAHRRSCAPEVDPPSAHKQIGERHPIGPSRRVHVPFARKDNTQELFMRERSGHHNAVGAFAPLLASHGRLMRILWRPAT